MRRTVAMMAVSMVVLAACGTDATVDTEAAADADYDVSQQPDDAQASFVSPSDGDTVTAPVTVELAADGATLTPAGEPVVGEGHLHVMADIGCVESGELLPGPGDEAEAEGYFHLGDGSDARELPLEPGEYELCVQLADGFHRAFGQTETIRVTVE
jgi:hypothetical protein